MVNLGSEPMAFSVLNLCFGNIEDFYNTLCWNCKLNCSLDLKPLVSRRSLDWCIILLDSSLELETSSDDYTLVDVSDDKGDRYSGVSHSRGGISAIVLLLKPKLKLFV